jgi:ubiquinone/menaquinone biosynthesis C-methylase UbiE
VKESHDPSYVPPHFLSDVKSTFQRTKDRTYALMHLSSGQSVLDIGCGPASDTLALADLVGPTGRVVGIDRDAGMIAAANDRAASAGATNVEHLHVNAVVLPFQDNSFGSCRSERVFQHLPDPSRVLAEVTRVLKPGGYLVLADPDFASMSTATTDQELLWGMKEAMSNFLPNGYAACSNYGLMKRAAFDDVTVEVVPIAFYNYEAFGVLLRARIDDILKAVGFPSRRFNEFETDVRRVSDKGQFFGCINMILTSGRKPSP